MRRAARLLDQRRSTVRSLRGLRPLLDDLRAGADPAAAVTGAARRLLPVVDSWFEPGPPATTLPELRPDGELDRRVLRRGRRGLALPGTVSVVVEGAGRLVLLADPEVGLTIEERLLAGALGGVLALALSPSTTGPLP